MLALVLDRVQGPRPATRGRRTPAAWPSMSPATSRPFLPSMPTRILLVASGAQIKHPRQVEGKISRRLCDRHPWALLVLARSAPRSVSRSRLAAAPSSASSPVVSSCASLRPWTRLFLLPSSARSELAKAVLLGITQQQLTGPEDERGSTVAYRLHCGSGGCNLQVPRPPAHEPSCKVGPQVPKAR